MKYIFRLLDWTLEHMLDVFIVSLSVYAFSYLWDRVYIVTGDILIAWLVTGIALALSVILFARHMYNRKNKGK